MSAAQEAGSPVLACPYRQNSSRPCDITQVQITDLASKRSVKTDSNRPAVCAPAVPPEKKALAAGYHLVLETMSAVILPYKHFTEEEKVAKIKAEVKGGEGCPDHGHILMLATPMNPDPRDDLITPTQYLIGESPIRTPAKFWEPADDPQATFNLATFFLQPAETIKTMEFAFERCGYRLSGDPVTSVRGLVRVYRKEEFELSIKLPPWKEKTYKSRKPTGDGGYEEKQTTGSLLHPGSVETKTVDKDGDVENSKTYSTGWIKKTEVTVDTETMEWEKPEKNVELSFSLKRNGNELETAKLITKIIQNLRQTVDGFTEALVSIKDFVPKVGWSGSVTASLCEGEITGSWGVRAQPDWDTPTAKWVTGYGELKFKLAVFTINASIQFGVEVSSPDILNWFGNKAWELIAIVKASIVGKLEMEGTLPLWGPSELEDGKRKVESNKASIDAEVFAQVKVSIHGVVLEVKAGFETGFDLEASFLCPFQLKLDASMRAGIVYAYWNAPGKQKNSPRWEAVIWEKKEIWKDKVLLPPGEPDKPEA